MTRAYWLGIAASLVTSGFIFVLLRRGYLRERFAAFWLAIASAVLVIAVFPAILTWGANLLGVEVPANLLFLLAAVVLLLVGVQLSFEVGRLDMRTQRLAEEIALLRADTERLRQDLQEREDQ